MSNISVHSGRSVLKWRHVSLVGKPKLEKPFGKNAAYLLNNRHPCLFHFIGVIDWRSDNDVRDCVVTIAKYYFQGHFDNHQGDNRLIL